MKIKTSELTGAALNWAVAKADDLPININPGHGFFVKHPDGWEYFTPSIDWAQGGPIIEREGLELSVHIIHNGVITGWACEKDWPSTYQKGAVGPTPLIAAMRCYVASKLGDEVAVPEELT